MILFIQTAGGSSSETIGLETYINQADGYSIKYPVYAELKKIETDGMRGIEIIGPRNFIASWSDYPAYRLQIIAHENPDNLSAKDWAQKRILKKWQARKPNEPFIGPVTSDGNIDESLVIDTQVNGLPAYQERWEGEDVSVIRTYIANEGKVYELIYEDYPVAKYPITDVVKGIYLMMLSTFEIIPVSKAEGVDKQKVALQGEKEPDANISKSSTVTSQKLDTVSVDNSQEKKFVSSELALEQSKGPALERSEGMAKTGIVLGDGTRVRDEPTLDDSQIAFKLNAGDKVELLDRTKTKESFSKIEGLLLNGGYLWYKVKKNNSSGWIYGQILQPFKPLFGVSVAKIGLYSKSVWYS